MQIVRMKEEHVAQIAALEQACFSMPWSYNSIFTELSNELSLWLVAEEDETVLGYIGSQTVVGESDMLNVAVAAESRRRGIGRQLVEALCDALRAEKSTCLTLEVRASNEAAKKLYESLGFQLIGKRPRYYTKPVEDAELYRKELGE